ncbi:aromatic ring-hydroxylating dioxygenase subunit alpha [Sphingomonas sp. MG17]|uniref:Aromatic ring-hydroxylating dioxygenase subunit alpha n=1 Tax=Sphingomonas tagetis TaxID=2949092 RepID=A0A9X2HKH5_9SPHN|nr:aromatic ring-hydroxylating dioxygenase subunit alpha [Sphingomonas tagetis]MCP3730326.1 aromatic ring-hydroxylating dioxygenase subunit alpha [Sphingomonas tagetis]
MIVVSEKDVIYHRQFDLPTAPVPVEPYRSPDFFKLEKERIFKRAWLNIAHANDVAKPGEYIVKDIAAADAKVIIVRGKDGVIRAFYDVCPHRGSKISPPGADSGCVRSLKCRYHSWNFDLDGRLVYIPDEAMFFSPEKETLNLLPVNCEIWEGFIFLNFQKTPDVTLAEFLGSFGQHYAGLQELPGFPLHPDTQSVKVQAVWKCNWKLAIGAFLEAYHIRTLHPKTIGNQYASSKNPFGHPEGIGHWGMHTAINLYGNSNFTPNPATSPVEAQFSARGYHGPRSRAEMVAAGLDHPAINVTRSEAWAQDIYLVFPNTFLYSRSYGSTVVRWWPLAHDKMIWEATLYFAKATNIRQRMAQEFAVGRQREVVMEDMINLAWQQDALATTPLEFMQYSDNEVMLRLLDQTVHRFIAADSVADML